MKLQEKLEYLKDNHLSEFLKKRQETEDRVSQGNAMFCFCGRLATGLHEMSCRTFRKKVDSVTVKSLRHLLLKEGK